MATSAIITERYMESDVIIHYAIKDGQVAELFWDKKRKQQRLS